MLASIIDATQSLEAETKFVIKQVGVVGLGHMGHGFAVNLVEDGYQVLGYDRDPSRSVTLTGVSRRGKARRACRLRRGADLSSR